MLVLWDIDGRLLVRASDAHRDAIHAALKRVYHVPIRRRPASRPAGRTDLPDRPLDPLPARVSATADRRQAHGLQAQRPVDEYARRCPADLSSHVVPGIPTSWRRWPSATDVGPVARDRQPQRSRTASSTPPGSAGSSRAGQGGFGSDHEDRTELPEMARTRAGRPGQPYPREDTVVVGDTPLDIACARADGVRCIAVTTGPYGADGPRRRRRDRVLGERARRAALAVDAQDRRRRAPVARRAHAGHVGGVGGQGGGPQRRRAARRAGGPRARRPDRAPVRAVVGVVALVGGDRRRDAQQRPARGGRCGGRPGAPG
jgi:phosphoglycolate phosphatase-like HAD superfamily hydrolase